MGDRLAWRLLSHVVEEDVRCLFPIVLRSLFLDQAAMCGVLASPRSPA
ncbi:MAG: hypothetical protein ACRDUX_15220 [Mycobacterium sp.]